MTPPALERLAEAGYDPVYGARPLKRAVQQLVENPLAQRILAGELRDRQTVRVDCDGTVLRFEAESSDPDVDREQREALGALADH